MGSHDKLKHIGHLEGTQNVLLKLRYARHKWSELLQKLWKGSATTNRTQELLCHHGLSNRHYVHWHRWFRNYARRLFSVRKEAGLPVELVGFFMLFTFVIVALIEIMLVRNLSKLMGSAERTQNLPTAPQPPLELRPPTTTEFGEPIGSVTDNTTRTLEYARRDR